MATEKQPRVTIPRMLEMKRQGQKITVLTAYDYPTAQVADEAGVEIVLVGDSVGMVVLGYENTLPVTMEEMLHHVKAVSRGVRRAFMVGDMPFLSYQGDPDVAVINAGRFLKEGGAHGVKIEGGATFAPLVERLVACGIPVMGHLGLMPQSLHQVGGYRAQGKTAEAAARLLRDARTLERAGAFSVVLELVPTALAQAVSQRLTIPTIGIGSGPGCDAQVQVVHDVLGLGERLPRHARRFAELRVQMREAFDAYAAEVRAGTFPAPANSIEMDPEELGKALEEDDRSA